MNATIMQERRAMGHGKRPESPLVSCIIPAFNEAGNIVALLHTLHELLDGSGYRHELLVVDDGSRDDTAQRVLTECRSLPVTLVQLSRNFGKEIALTAGIDHAQGDVAVLIDGDFQHPPEMVPTFLEKWRAGYDMVYSVRPDRIGESLGKRLFTRAFYVLVNLGSPQKIPANTQDFRVLDRCVLDALRQMPERNRFMKGLYNWVGFSQLAVECATAERRAGTSSFNFRRLLNLGLTGVTAFSNMPLRIWTLIGCCISLCSILYALWELLRTLLFGNPLSGWPTLTVAITFLGGVQLLSVGILGEYIGRIFDEVKQRPTYLVRQVVRPYGETTP
ncbi:glycosyltransferase family 2 protein [Ectopseudomonas hydrolytica]|uniref:Glycosyltransferase family 2 protein n=1 Tax=Ectopseudomonas hydrolytica TaxID=2493633 RepID=A0ABY5A229_9GAMM|nr:glycosyltransferase family 2 protein [Pseudomonas hydrolytica]OCX15303.1 glycosyl transferase family 2 [Stutzerimonas xanthomarina]USR37655.1 glycosyltransferase family 2 protein [Pseudomonas hydrolytica]